MSFDRTAGRKTMKLLIVTGMSGAGKTLATNALEDIGFFCIDNIPAGLLPKLVEFSQQSENPLQKIAIVLDARGGRSADEIMLALTNLRERGVEYHVLFLDARDDVLTRRYQETRRRHPLSDPGQPIEQAVRRERAILQPLYASADYKIDTSMTTTAQLKDRVTSLFAESGVDAMRLTVLSFGFKYGIPQEADVVFDVRCLPNPFYVPELKEKTGLDSEVYEYVLQFAESRELLRRMESLLEYAVPLYAREGKSQLTIAVGCTGGKHRSITFARALADYFRKKGYHPIEQHRDVRRRYSS